MTLQQIIARELAHDRPGFDTEQDLRHARNILDALEREHWVIHRDWTWNQMQGDLNRANRLLREHGIDPNAGLA